MNLFLWIVMGCVATLQMVFAYPFYESLTPSDGKHSYYDGSQPESLGPSNMIDEESDMTEDFLQYPDYPHLLAKRLHPRFSRAYEYKSPSYIPSFAQTAESKRYRNFHPLPRFRGLSMGSSGALIPAIDFSTTYDRPPSNQPMHPVASGSQGSHVTEEPTQSSSSSDKEKPSKSFQTQGSGQRKISAGELIRYLNTIASNGNVGSRPRTLRFGLSKK